MAEYIEREAVVRAFCEHCRDYVDKCTYDGTCEVDIIATVPTADVQPVKRGHWYHNTSKYISELDAYFIQACCSYCGRYSDRIDSYTVIMSNEFCSHCGADMRTE